MYHFYAAFAAFSLSVASAEVGIFANHKDIGNVAHAGAATFEPHSKSYRIAGGGENMWFATDDFHFVYNEAKGDLSLAAEITFPTTGGNAHKKAVLMFRQTLEPDSP